VVCPSCPAGADMTSEQATRSFRESTRKRKGEAVLEDGLWTVVDAQGHVWCLFPSGYEGDALIEGGWTRMTDDDDPYVLDLKRGRWWRVACR
jgi:hypothetical protein